MIAARYRTCAGWSAPAAFPDLDAAYVAINATCAALPVLGYMIASNHVSGPFEPGIVPRTITLIVDNTVLDGSVRPKNFWNPESVQTERKAA